MKKIHGRVKRRLGLTSTHSHYKFFHPGIKVHRPKTFGTADAAKAWAEKNGLKAGEYTVKTAKKDKRFQIETTKKKKK